jgi:hypothetical protein
MKQETLEEAAANLADPNLCKTDNWIAGAKWQQQQDKNKYSEEEVKRQLNILITIKSSVLDTFTDDDGFITDKWFEQFKK